MYGKYSLHADMHDSDDDDSYADDLSRRNQEGTRTEMIKGLLGVICRLLAVITMVIAGSVIAIAALGLLIVWCVKHIIGTAKRSKMKENRYVYDIIDVTEG